MVALSWVVSIILASPQAFMFRKLKHPDIEFYQCTTTMAVEDFSEKIVVNGQLKFLFLGVEAETIYRFYHFSFLLFVFFFPLTFLMVNYFIIIKLIRRYNFTFKFLQFCLCSEKEILQVFFFESVSGTWLIMLSAVNKICKYGVQILKT